MQEIKGVTNGGSRGQNEKYIVFCLFVAYTTIFRAIFTFCAVACTSEMAVIELSVLFDEARSTAMRYELYVNGRLIWINVLLCSRVTYDFYSTREMGGAFREDSARCVYAGSQNKRPISSPGRAASEYAKHRCPKMKFECRHSLPIYINSTFAVQIRSACWCCCWLSEWGFSLPCRMHHESERCLAWAEYPTGQRGAFSPEIYLSTLHCVVSCILAGWELASYFPSFANNFFSSAFVHDELMLNSLSNPVGTPMPLCTIHYLLHLSFVLSLLVFEPQRQRTASENTRTDGKHWPALTATS